MSRTIISLNGKDLYDTSELDKEFAEIEQKKKYRLNKIKKVEPDVDKNRPG